MNDIMTTCVFCDYKNNPQTVNECLYCGENIDTGSAVSKWIRGYITECFENNKGATYPYDFKYIIRYTYRNEMKFYVSKFSHHISNMLLNLGFKKYSITFNTQYGLLEVYSAK